MVASLKQLKCLASQLGDKRRARDMLGGERAVEEKESSGETITRGAKVRHSDGESQANV